MKFLIDIFTISISLNVHRLNKWPPRGNGKRAFVKEYVNYCPRKEGVWHAVFFCVAQQPSPGLGRPVFEVSRLHAVRQTHLFGLLWTSSQLIAEATTCTTHNKHKRRTAILWTGFEPASAAIERLQTCNVDLTATGISWHFVISWKF